MEQGITFVLSGKTFHLVDISNEGERWFSLSETSKRYISKINFNKCNLKWVVEAGFTSIGQQIQKAVQESRELHFQEKFDSDYTNDLRDNVLQHMRKLWNNWRGSLHKNVKSKSLHQVLKDVPMGVDKGDWEWLVKEHFLSDKFKEASTRNSINRSKLCMPHRTGSKPIRKIVYELGGKDGNYFLNVKGGKDGNPPNMATIFFETRKKDNELVQPETNEKYAEIHELVQSEPSLTNIEVVEKCFGPQCKGCPIGFGGGITSKELKGGTTSKAALLEELKTLQVKKKRNHYKNAWIFYRVNMNALNL